ncbi:MAG: hypothetical protein KDG89_15040 [Geminicoccaceae bacterium]|nr:hypothetical protein [Geminicoccaceae bacterium]
MPAHVNWHQAALKLAQGGSPAEAAAAAGCTVGRLRRKQGQDGVLAALVECYRVQPAANGEAKLAVLRGIAQDAIERGARTENLKVVLWLADRVKLVRPQPGADDPLDGLSAEEREALAALDARAAGLR